MPGEFESQGGSAATPEAAPSAGVAEAGATGGEGESGNIGLFSPADRNADGGAGSPAQQPQQTPAPVASAPAPNPWASMTPQQFAQMQAQAFAQANRPQQQPKQQPWQDRQKFWTIPEGHPDPAGEFHGRLEQFVGHAVESATGPLVQQIEALTGALQYLNANKASDPEFAAIENDVNELLQSGSVRDIKLAREIATLRRKASGAASPAAPVQSGPVFGQPKPVPTPPPHASTQNPRPFSPSPVKFDPKQRPDITKITEGLLAKAGF